MFEIDFNKIIQLLLPPVIRKATLVMYLNAILTPLKSIYNTFTSYRNETLRAVSHTGQVIYIEKILNDMFAPSGSGITITDSDDDRLDDYLYNDSEGETPIWLYNDSEIPYTAVDVRNDEEYYFIYDFVVNIPVTLSILPSLVSNVVNKYKQAGKRFYINNEFIIE